ncbi:MAG: FmdB family zinc ribbon protein, partial [Gemmatimonadaceae bacterium]
PEGHDFEKFYRSIGAAPSVVSCPVCGKTAERQLSAGAGLVFKGSGFYITDYGKDGKKPQTAPSAGKSAEASSGSEAAGSSDTKAKTEGAAAPKTGTESKAASSSKAAPEGPSSKKAKDTE